MEELDDILLTRQVDLDLPEEETSNPGRTAEREKLTESLIRHDVVAPNVVQFTHSYKPNRKWRRLACFLGAVALSVLGIYHFSRVVTDLSREAVLDIDIKMEVVAADSNSTNPKVNTTARQR